MSRITPYLYLGDAKDAQNQVFLTSKKVVLIVNCAKELPNYFEGQFRYARLDWDDVPQQDLSMHLDNITDTIVNTMKRGNVVFVHCAAGISRSSSVVINVIKKLHRWNFDQAFNFVRECRPIVNPNPGFVRQLRGQMPTHQDNTENFTQLDVNVPLQQPEEKDNSVKKWSNLTMDCPECEKPQYTKSGKYRYAHVFG